MYNVILKSSLEILKIKQLVRELMKKNRKNIYLESFCPFCKVKMDILIYVCECM